MNTKGYSYPKTVILQAVYFKLRFTLSYHYVEEIMKKRKGRAGSSWRLDETNNVLIYQR